MHTGHGHLFVINNRVIVGSTKIIISGGRMRTHTHKFIKQISRLPVCFSVSMLLLSRPLDDFEANPNVPNEKQKNLLLPTAVLTPLHSLDHRVSDEWQVRTPCPQISDSPREAKAFFVPLSVSFRIFTDGGGSLKYRFGFCILLRRTERNLSLPRPARCGRRTSPALSAVGGRRRGRAAPGPRRARPASGPPSRRPPGP